MSATNVEVHFGLDFFMEAINMNPDQTAPQGSSLICVHIVCNIGYLNIYIKQMREQLTKAVGLIYITCTSFSLITPTL